VRIALVGASSRSLTSLSSPRLMDAAYPCDIALDGNSLVCRLKVRRATSDAGTKPGSTRPYPQLVAPVTPAAVDAPAHTGLTPMAERGRHPMSEVRMVADLRVHDFICG